MRYDIEAAMVAGPNITDSGLLLHEHPARVSDELRGPGRGAIR
jgi:hypothetical protein